MTIDKISFGHTYRIYCQDAKKYHHQNLIIEGAREQGAQVRRTYAQLHADNFGFTKEKVNGIDAMYCDTVVIRGNGDLDKKIRQNCADAGIFCQVLFENNLDNKDLITQRITLGKYAQERNLSLVDLDVERFEELMKNQRTNFEHVESDYKNGYFNNDLQYIIGSGNKIEAPILFINSNLEIEELEEYAKRYGADNLNPKTLNTNLVNADSANHVLYFELKKRGLETIPVAVNEETRRILEILGVIK